MGPPERATGQPRAVDVLLVSLGSTPGLRVADRELRDSIERAGARVALVETAVPGEVRTLMLTDLRWARAARSAAARALAQLGPISPRAVIYSSTTAALLWPLPGAIRFDAPAAANRPGRHGLWQRPLERLRLRQAPLLLPWSEGGLAEARTAAPGCGERAVVLHPPIELGRATAEHGGIGPAGAGGVVSAVERDIAAVTYAGNPRKKGFDRVLAAWRGARRPGERLAVVGIARERLRAAGFEVPDEDVELLGSLPQAELRELLRRARIFLCAPRREDYGLIQLEALAAGCMLVTTPAPGPYAALALARRLDPRLVGEDLGVALHAALRSPPGDYAPRAARMLEPFGRTALDRRIAHEVLPRLLG